MTLLNLLNVRKQYNHKIILDNANFHIQKGERIAIIGKNGSGKSTLLGLLAGVLEADAGERVVSKNLQILTLQQSLNFPPNFSVAQVIEEGLNDLKAAHTRLSAIQQTLQSCADSILEEYANLSNFIDEHNAWDLESLVSEVIENFGLHEFRDRLATSLSGGEQKKIALCRLFLTSADLLILDEPTNHLDTEMVGFLESFLKKSKLSIVFVSHDRYFIENIATRVVEVENAKLENYDGGYISYLAQKEEKLRALCKIHQNLLKTLKREEEWLRRGVQARVKRNEGRKNRLLSLREEAKTNPSIINKMRLEIQRQKKHFNRSEGKNAKKCLFEIENLSKDMYGKTLLKDFSIRILQGEKIAVVGKNGSGKSTFLKLLLGKITPSGGVIKRGNIRIGYFDQHLDILDDSKDLFETFCPNGGDSIEVRGKSMHIFGYLKNFLFPKEFLNKKIGFLSGGEKKRVALALLFTKEVDVLLLDEPTNDLDIATISIVEEYLSEFNGALIFVSHDRYFVDKLASKLLVYGENASLSESYTSYSEYLELDFYLKELHSLEQESVKNTTKPHTQTKPVNSKKTTKLSYKESLLLENLPDEITTLEKQIACINDDLSKPEVYKTKGISTLAEQLCQLQSALDSKLMLYFELQEKQENLQK
ncbi:ribosomal protection-like ABC-F family protein [Helicobacter sp. 10-6591]|uniref:ribosomal protection-like ABC-F family protein n=1 Tax=Helicobacter sp. 10-6591 TaxID=2004998 RepID=UPI000DCAF10E|nr:ABC-F family ATP-binding cassette domain-containing protein [Helicobacter sp. 10-6591]RAX53106.1 ABC transporter ATP-binding protein [Helicobacter sp. 10-6591]